MGESVARKLEQGPENSTIFKALQSISATLWVRCNLSGDHYIGALSWWLGLRGNYGSQWLCLLLIRKRKRQIPSEISSTAGHGRTACTHRGGAGETTSTHGRSRPVGPVFKTLVTGICKRGFGHYGLHQWQTDHQTQVTVIRQTQSTQNRENHLRNDINGWPNFFDVIDPNQIWLESKNNRYLDRIHGNWIHKIHAVSG